MRFIGNYGLMCKTLTCKERKVWTNGKHNNLLKCIKCGGFGKALFQGKTETQHI